MHTADSVSGGTPAPQAVCAEVLHEHRDELTDARSVELGGDIGDQVIDLAAIGDRCEPRCQRVDNGTEIEIGFDEGHG